MLFLVCLLVLLDVVAPHGRLINPPARSSMWRYGFRTPKNYNDNALFCGGLAQQWEVNAGRCGICGDAFDDPLPRSNEAGGKYATGTISAYYSQGHVIRVDVEVTANHGGYFEFRLCPLKWYMAEASESCLNRHKLLQTNGKDSFVIPEPKVSNNYTILLQLPEQVTCDRCVLQWKWVTANSWGCNRPDDCCIGCGHQEHFVNCADISIQLDGSGPLPDTSHDKQQYSPTLPRNKQTILVTQDGQEILLESVPISNVPKPAGAQSDYQAWMETVPVSHAPGPDPKTDTATRLDPITQTSRPDLQQGHQTWMEAKIGIQPEGFIDPIRTTGRVSSAVDQPQIPTQEYSYSGTSSSYAVDPVQPLIQMNPLDPHMGQDYSSSGSSNAQTTFRPQNSASQSGSKSGTSSTGSKSTRPAPESPPVSSRLYDRVPDATSVSSSPDIPLGVLRSLAALMKNAKHETCRPKFRLEGFSVDCDQICVPSGGRCVSRRRKSGRLDAACTLMCTVVV